MDRPRLEHATGTPPEFPSFHPQSLLLRDDALHWDGHECWGRLRHNAQRIVQTVRSRPAMMLQSLLACQNVSGSGEKLAMSVMKLACIPSQHPAGPTLPEIFSQGSHGL